MEKYKIVKNYLCCAGIALLASCTSTEISGNYTIYPENQEKDIHPDTHLKITFAGQPIIGSKGKIRVFESQTDSLVDLIDMSIPAGPTKPVKNPEATYTSIPYQYLPGKFTNANTKPGTPSGTALATADTFQLTIIGGFTDAFHFYPIIVHENTAIISLHHNLLEYNKDYYVLIDSSVVSSAKGSFKGIYNKNVWRFSTSKNPPDLRYKKIIVDDEGNGDFSSLQGALDYIPNDYKDTVEIFIRNGLYDELIYFRNKSNIIIKGENREKTVIQYANNEVFNPHPWNVKTNEWPGTFPSRRAAFAIDNCTNIQLLNLTVKTLLQGQAEGLLINGSEIFVKGVHIVGSGDALQTNGSACFEDVKIDGGGDMILGRGPAFFKDCDFYSPGPFMWTRNTKANHGNVFLNCRFTGTNPNGSTLARAPVNKGFGYPYSECVFINCSLKNILPKGWGTVGGETKNMHYWEYNSTNIDDGKPVDLSQRADFSRQLRLDTDKELIENYSNPLFVLDGWSPFLNN
ncbi:carbohydrate esterase [Labilibaculum sp. A4]|uniref:pectinesterase family protein n=1 Tax=Labilibaculum euxinus TaxID=2686357 RepID=UPI000F62262C|nr:pectinesterase family protein [Labilibaculum euxinus]MDQ1772868.1 pectinesterase family protein [Labilibaculum euxinus]MWN78590.1 carbohydrate esterase [Labilibaculum euxinus]